MSLPEAIQQHLRDGLLEAGHARVLLGLPAAAAKALAQIAVAQKLSVREVEARARRLALADPKAAAKSGKAAKGGLKSGQADWDRMQEDLADALGLTVRLTPKGKAGGGELKVQFSSLEEFQGLLDRLMPDRAGH